MSGGITQPCQKLPIPLTICPCCKAGVKFSRGWTWVTNDLIKDAKCIKEGCVGCVPFNDSVEEFGLMWVGERHYPRPIDFTREALNRGVSKRVANIPKKLVLGETWLLVAHKKAIIGKNDECSPGIFHAFIPTHLEYVVSPDDDMKKLKRLEDRGIKLVEVIPEEDLQEKLPLKNEEDKVELSRTRKRH